MLSLIIPQVFQIFMDSNCAGMIYPQRKFSNSQSFLKQWFGISLLLVLDDRSCLGRGFVAPGVREPHFCTLQRGAISAITKT
ncbi:asl8021 (plasmid) [Nostoc sp. PCC 7120 = FACHB-418]|nr:asl8021 [Nostoc sp. PCC 7120 = FACHB-418]